MRTIAFKNFIFIIFAALVLFCGNTGAAKEKIVAHSEESPISLGVTHLLPGVFVIPSGELILGTSVGFGILDLIEFSSNVWLDLEQVFNVSTKIGIYHSHDFGVAVWGTYSSQILQTSLLDQYGNTISTQNTTSTAVTPGFTLSYRLAEGIVTHFGAGFTQRSPPISKASLTQRTGFIEGNVLYHEYGFGLGKSIAFAPGVSYDTTYDIWGAGATVHVAGFQIGAHYYFNVSTGSLLPLIGGAYTAEY